MQDKLDQEVATLKEQWTELRTKAASATGEAKVNAEAQLAVVRAKLQATEMRIQAAIAEAGEQQEKRIATLQNEAGFWRGQVAGRGTYHPDAV